MAASPEGRTGHFFRVATLLRMYSACFFCFFNSGDDQPRMVCILVVLYRVCIVRGDVLVVKGM